MIVAATVALLAIGALLALILWLRGRARAAAASLRRDLGPQQILLIDTKANFFGHESAGGGQVRGNGCLALTRGELVFRMWAPDRDTRIPRTSIIRVDTPRSHAGKTRGRTLVRVVYRREDGEVDAAAWLVSGDPHSWVSSLRQSTIS